MSLIAELHSLLKDILTMVGFSLEPEHLMAFVAGVMLHTLKYSFQHKIKPWDLWTHDRKWSLATLVAAATALITMDEMYHPANPDSLAPIILYFLMGTFCNSFFNSNPSTLKSKIAQRAEQKLGVQLPPEVLDKVEEKLTEKQEG